MENNGQNNNPQGPNNNMPGGNGNGNNGNGPQKKQSLFMLVLAVLFTLLFMSFMMRMASSASSEITYSKFLELVKNGEVKSVLIKDSEIEIELKSPKQEISANAVLGGDTGPVTTKYYTGNLEDDNLYAFLDEHNVEYSKEIPDSSGMILNFMSRRRPVLHSRMLPVRMKPRNPL